MISSNTVPAPRPIWDHVGSPSGADWRSLVYAAGYAADERSAPLHAVRGLDEAIARVRAVDDDLGSAIQDAVTEAKAAIYDTALVLGVALARTWPDRLEDLDAWPDRALAHAEITATPAAS